MSSQSFGYRQISDIGPSHVCSTAKAALGDRQWWKGDEYVYVYNDGSTQISPGLGCVLTGLSGYSVTVSSVTEVNECAGIVKHATLTTGDYGWVLTRGFVAVEADADTGLAAADRIVMGDNGVSTRVTGATALVQQQRIHGIMMDATGSGGSALAHVHCFL